MNQNESDRGAKLGTRSMVVRVVVGVCSWLIIFALVMLRMLPQKHMLKVGDIANESIKASHDVVDTVTTQQKKQAASDKVDPKYRQDDTVTAEVVSKLDECYAAMDTIRSSANDEIRKMNRGEISAAVKDINGDIQFAKWFLTQCHNQLPGSYTDEDMRYILLCENKMLDTLKDKVMSLTTKSLKNGIKEEYLSEQVSSINQELISPLNRFDDGAKRLGMNLVTTYLKANFIFDAEATAAARAQAADEVEPEIYKRGQIIVSAGLPVTDAQLQILSSLGLLDDSNPHILIYVGVGVFTAVLMLVLWLYVMIFEPEVFASLRRLLLLNSVFVMTVLFAWLATEVHAYFLLSFAGTLLIAVLLNYRLAITVNTVLAMLAGIISGSDSSGSLLATALPAAIAALTGGLIALFVLRRSPQRSSLMFAGIVAGGISMVTIVAVDLLSSFEWQSILTDAVAALSGGLASAMLCLGTLPLWESLFKVVTPMKLLELANPNLPLLKRLLIEAPGTYHHSIIVGNLAESAADAIGANAMLARTGAYYHDVGKLLRPYFFTENQMGGESPHESISPELSKRILTSHPKDGVDLAAKYGIPQQILDIILEHHGTTPTMFFYHKAVKQAEAGETINLDDYRYPGPKPHTREAAIIMLADSVEAGARSLQEHSQEKLDEFVQGIVNMKLEDGQFDKCDLTLRDLGIITAELRKVLGGIYHERIAYPVVELKKGVRLDDEHIAGG